MGSARGSGRLFEPLQIGNHTLSSRIVMAPLTRFRAGDDHVQLSFAKDYYAQRACVPGTLLITEATFISPGAGGYANVPGVWSAAQIAAWKEIVDAVHAKGGVIFMQLWALGRVASAEVKKAEGTGDVVSCSAVPASEDGPVPREMTEEEIWEYVRDYATAAKNAVEGAGFDGVEIHGANGYIVDQFAQDVTNKRTDGWGGSVEKRSRFGLEVTKAVVDAVGAHRTGIRLSPWSTFQGMRMADPVPQFSHLIEGLKRVGKLAYIHLVESRISGNADVESTEKCDPFIKIWSGTSPVLLAGGFTAASAEQCVNEEYRQEDLAIVFGRSFIANPDLVYRMREGIEFHKYDRSTFYKPGSMEGYIDQPFSEQWLKEHGGS